MNSLRIRCQLYLYNIIFAVTGFAVLLICGTHLRIVDDMLFQSADLRQSLFRLLNRGEQGISFGSLLLHMLVQLLHAFNLIIPQKQQRLRHLLQVINRCPALISDAFVLQLTLGLLHIRVEITLGKYQE